ncbi:MAG: UDP-N-acetylglucosamine 2-epimerase [Alphaproteobacteria bacterium]
MMRVALVSVARSDYGIYRPLLRALRRAPQFDMQLIVAGDHCADAFGRTITEIERDPWPIAASVDMTPAGDGPPAMAAGMGRGCIGLAQAYERLKPDLLFVLGDRFEMLAAAAAATPFPIPIAHLHGGSLTEGARDDAIRHAITKLSHLHFADHESCRRRILQMGEEPERVYTVGALALDGIHVTPLIPAAKLMDELNLASGEQKPLLVTFHPVTQEPGRASEYMNNLFAALDAVALPVVFTYPNADPEGQEIIALVKSYTARRKDAVAIANLGAHKFHSLCACAAAMVGNSSSGIIEAMSFHLPVVDIGTRQKNRFAPNNVIHCGYDAQEIERALRRACSQEFRQSLAGLENPYGDGRAADRILNVLKNPPDGGFGTLKRFRDLMS